MLARGCAIAVELAIADDPFAQQSAVEDAVDQAFLTPVRDGKGSDAPAALGKRTRMKRAGRPSVPKTFGSRSR